MHASMIAMNVVLYTDQTSDEQQYSYYRCMNKDIQSTIHLIGIQFHAQVSSCGIKRLFKVGPNFIQSPAILMQYVCSTQQQPPSISPVIVVPKLFALKNPVRVNCCWRVKTRACRSAAATIVHIAIDVGFPTTRIWGQIRLHTPTNNVRVMDQTCLSFNCCCCADIFMYAQ